MTNITLNNNIKIQQGKFYVAVWGCQMNVYDGQRIEDLMTASGYVKTDKVEDANVVILITCAVRAKAEDKVFNQLGAWRASGLINENTIICFGGCVGSEIADDIQKIDKSVNVIFGPRTTHRLPYLIKQYQETQQIAIDVDANALEKFDMLPMQGAVGASAFVTIMEGCSNKCSYCIVPYTRGEEDSRPVQDILDEVINHIANGVKEIHLLGQNVNSYRGTFEDGSICHFSTLLYEVAAIDGVERIRFTTSNPMDFTDDIVKAIEEIDIISDAIHIPVQSGSNRILELMRRRYTRESYKELINKLRKARPNVHISTDIIVGFPNETEEDFNDTMELVESVNFDQSFSFIYSKRPGTPAATMPDDVSLETKKARLYKLQAKLEEQALAYSQKMLGTTQRVLVEGLSRKDATELKSRASNNRIVVFKGDPSLIGQMVTVKIVEAISHTLKGELLSD